MCNKKHDERVPRYTKEALPAKGSVLTARGVVTPADRLLVHCLPAKGYNDEFHNSVS